MKANKKDLVLLGLLLDAAPALASGSVTTQFNAAATVLSACTVSASDLTFGNYSASSPTPMDISNSMSISCTNALPYTISLDGGLTAASVAARTMTDGASHYLNYFLYSNSSHATIWGDGTAGTTTLSGTGSGGTQSVSIYGRVPAAQFLNAGAYADKVTITINY